MTPISLPDMQDLPLDKAQQILLKFYELAPTMQIVTAMVLLHIALRGETPEGVTVSEVTAHMRLSNSTGSRNVSYWEDRIPIHDNLDRQFIRVEISKQDKRRRLLKLTSEGRRFVNELAAILGDSLPYPETPMTKPRPFDEAPTDGTPILIDEGGDHVVAVKYERYDPEEEMEEDGYWAYCSEELNDIAPDGPETPFEWYEHPVLRNQEQAA